MEELNSIKRRIDLRNIQDPLEFDNDGSNTNINTPSINNNITNYNITNTEQFQLQLQEINKMLLSNYVPATHKAFEEKLSKAMEKNFAYIKKKDEQATQAILQGSSKSIYGPNNNTIGNFISVDNKQSLYGGFLLVNTNKNSSSYLTQSINNSTRSGIGNTIQLQNKKNKNNECTSVYISGLPLDITEEEINILFSPQGDIKKIKIYTLPNGAQKGDALVIYHKAESATNAKYKLHNLDIGDGNILNVSLADFSNSNITNSLDMYCSNNNNNNTITTITIKDTTNIILTYKSAIDKVRSKLPKDMEAHIYPILVLFNVFDNTLQQQNIDTDPDFYDDLENDMLEDCQKFGTVRLLHILSFTKTLINNTAGLLKSINTTTKNITSSRNNNKDIITIESLLYYSQKFQPNNNIINGNILDGAIAVTYESISSVINAAKSLHNRKFDGKQVWALPIIPPNNFDDILSELNSNEADNNNSINNNGTNVTTTGNNNNDNIATTATSDNNKVNTEEDVEDFLNSLL